MAVVKAPVTVESPVVSAVARAPPVPVPNAATTAPTTQAATITYSNDTTPSLSVLRRFTDFNVILQHKRNFLLLDEIAVATDIAATD